MPRTVKRLFAAFAAIAAMFIASAQFSAHAAAPGWQAYDAASFTAAQAKGKTIVADVQASWCPTCRAQAPILEDLRKEKQSADVLFIKVDFDKDKDFLRAHRIPRQSTIVVFKGKTEVARSIAETDRTRLRGVVLGAL